MLLTPRRLAFTLPLLVLLAVGGSHLGFRSGMHHISRAELNTGTYYNPADGCFMLYEGAPVLADADMARRLGSLFRGAKGADAGDVVDERPLVPFLHALLGSGVFGVLWVGILLNFTVAGLASVCAVDLTLRLGQDLETAALFGCLFAGSRGVAHYIGVPDAHMTALSWFPIAAWLHERLALRDPRSPREHVIVYGLTLGAALVTYLGDIGLLGFLWLYGLGRTPFWRLVGITALALGVAIGWRLAGRAAGLPFDTGATHVLGEGFREIATLLGQAWSARGDAPVRDARLATLLHVTTAGLVPAFGIPLLALGAAGLVFGTGTERRLALALFLPGVVAAWPFYASYGIVSRISYPGATGLQLSAGLALGALGRGTRRLARALGLGERTSTWAGIAAALPALVLVVLYESSEIFGRASLWID